MGTPEFACPALAALCLSKHEVQAVVTGEDQRTPRGRRLVPTAVCAKARDHGVEVIHATSLKDQALCDRIGALAPDLIVVVAFKILPEKLYKLPKFGSINVHASLLPKYRGAAPINWALINGEKETGLSAFFLKKKVDTGDILCQQSVEITDDDNFDSLHARLSETAGPFLLNTVDLIESGQVEPLAQHDDRATEAPKITPAITEISFEQPAEQVRNFVRGLSSQPGAGTSFRGDRVKILACRVVDCEQNEAEPGSVLPDRKRLLVKCSEQAVEVLSLVPQGKKQMDGSAFVNGFRPKKGEPFGRTPELKE